MFRVSIPSSCEQQSKNSHVEAVSSHFQNVCSPLSSPATPPTQRIDSQLVSTSTLAKEGLVLADGDVPKVSLSKEKSKVDFTDHENIPQVQLAVGPMEQHALQVEGKGRKRGRLSSEPVQINGEPSIKYSLRSSKPRQQ
jgi:hypothetical protein